MTGSDVLQNRPRIYRVELHVPDSLYQKGECLWHLTVYQINCRTYLRS